MGLLFIVAFFFRGTLYPVTVMTNEMKIQAPHSILWTGFPLKNAEYRVTKKDFKDASVLDTPAPVPYPHQVIQAGLLCVLPN